MYIKYLTVLLEYIDLEWQGTANICSVSNVSSHVTATVVYTVTNFSLPPPSGEHAHPLSHEVWLLRSWKVPTWTSWYKHEGNVL